MELATFVARDVKYRVAIVDDGLELDPVVLIFRGDEEEAVATIHLKPGSPCQAYGDYGHVVVREEED